MKCLGIGAVGGIFAGVNFEFRHAFKIAKARCFIVEQELLKNAPIAAEACNIPRSRIFVFDVHGWSIPETLKSWSALQEYGYALVIRIRPKIRPQRAYSLVGQRGS